METICKMEQVWPQLHLLGSSRLNLALETQFAQFAQFSWIIQIELMSTSKTQLHSHSRNSRPTFTFTERPFEFDAVYLYLYLYLYGSSQARKYQTIDGIVRLGPRFEFTCIQEQSPPAGRQSSAPLMENWKIQTVLGSPHQHG